MTSVQPEIVVAGHICVDLIPQLPARCGDMATLLAPGRLVRVGPADVSLGGAVANTGLALHRLGASVGLLGKVGDDVLGGLAMQLLGRASSALAEQMVVAPGEATSYSVVISPPGGDRCFLHAPGANDTFRAAEVDVSQLGGCRVFHFGYPPIMHEFFADGGAGLAALFAQLQQAGVLVSLDMAMPDPASPAGEVDWRQWLATVLPHVDLFVPSFDETLFMLDRDRFDDLSQDGGNLAVSAGIPTIQQFADALGEMGAACVALKLGDQGLYLRTGMQWPGLEQLLREPAACLSSWHSRELLAPCFAVDFVGATGSGDATVAGLLYALVAGRSPEDAILAAVGVGASSVEQADATSGVPPWETLRKRILRWQQRDAQLALGEQGWKQDQRAWYGPCDSVAMS